MEAAQKTIKDNKQNRRKGFKKIKIGWIPEDWEVTRIDESVKTDDNLHNSQNILLRTQTASTERIAIFLVLKIAAAIPVRQKSALPFSYCVLHVVTELIECAHDEDSRIIQVSYFDALKHLKRLKAQQN